MNSPYEDQFLDAIMRDDADNARSLLAKGIDIEASDNDWGARPIHLAARYGSLSCLRLFIENGVDISSVDNNGWSALHYAAGNKKAECVVYLLQAGLDINMTNNRGETAMDIASEYTSLVNLIKKFIASSDEKNSLDSCISPIPELSPPVLF